MRETLDPPYRRSTGLVDVLDRVLDKGLIVAGDVRISLADVELLTIRIRLLTQFPQGRFTLRVEHTTLRLGDQRRFLAGNAASIASFKARQQRAFEEERERWKQSGTAIVDAEAATNAPPPAEASEVPEGCIAVDSPVTGSVWQVSVSPGARVATGDTLVVVEAMKMEVPILAEHAAEVVEVRCARGRTVSAGETVLVLRPLP